MIASNPFAQYSVDIPKRYREQILQYCRTGGNKSTWEFAPFQRQIDFWYTSYLLAMSQELDPVEESDTYIIERGTIFSNDYYRIIHMQIAYYGRFGSLEALSDHRKVFNFCLGMANAGMPTLIQILSNPEDRPLWSLLEEIEQMLT